MTERLQAPLVTPDLPSQPDGQGVGEVTPAEIGMPPESVLAPPALDGGDVQTSVSEAPIAVDGVAVPDGQSLYEPASVAFAADQVPDRPGRVRRAIETPLRLFVKLQNMEPKKRRFLALGAVATAVGVFAATKDAHVAQTVTEQVTGHGHEALAQTGGAHEVVHAQDMSYTIPDKHAESLPSGHTHVRVESTKTVQSADTAKKKHQAIAEAVRRVVGAGVKPHNYPDVPPDIYAHSSFLEFLNDSAATGVPGVVFSALPVLGFVRARNALHNHSERKERVLELREYEEATSESRRAIVNDGRPGPIGGDAYIRLARDETVGNGPLLDGYMNYMNSHAGINSPKAMAEHLRGMKITIHESEIFGEPGNYHYFPQGRNGFAADVLKGYMDGPTVPAGITNANGMYQHLRGLGLKVESWQISARPNRAGNTEFYYAHVNRAGKPIKMSTIGNDSGAPGVKPSRSGVFATNRGEKAANVLREATREIPLYDELLGDPTIATEMQRLRYNLPAIPGVRPAIQGGFLNDRQQLVRQISRATAATPPGVVAMWNRRLNTVNADILASLNTILAPIPHSQSATKFFGIRSYVYLPADGPDFTIANFGDSMGGTEARVAEIVRQWDVR